MKIDIARVRTVTGEECLRGLGIGQIFIHKTLAEDSGWTVTHKPTGYAIRHYADKDTAVRVAIQIFDEFPWETLTLENCPEHAPVIENLLRRAEENKAFNVKRQRLSADLKAKIFQRDNHSCVSCGGGSSLSIDHIKPVVLGGTNDESNLQSLCARCNRSKGYSYRPKQMLKGAKR